MNTTLLDRALREAFGESEGWDADGVQIDCGNDIASAVVALDCTSDVIRRAVSSGASAIITHHPLIFHPLKSVLAADSVGKRVSECIKNGISVLSYHTCLDITAGGVNDSLCAAVGITGTTPFLPFGRCGTLASPEDFGSFAARVSAALGSPLQNTVDCGRPVCRVAVVSGGGRSYVGDAVSTGADTYLTGEVTHDALVDCREYGINLVCATHFATENIVLPFLAEKVREVSGITVTVL